MGSNSKSNRIRTIIDAIEKALTGDASVVLDLSPKKDELDSLAEVVNNLLKKINNSLPSPASNLREERFRSLLDRMQESYVEMDMQGNIIFFNDRVTSKLGYTREEISGMNFRKLLNKENKNKLYEIGRNILLTGNEVQGLEWQLIKKDGQRIDVEYSIALLRDEQGQPAGFNGFVRDITPRKQAERKLRFSEERYRNILDSIEESYFEVDLQGNLLFFNDAMVRSLNYTHEEIIQMNFRKLVDEDNAKKVFEIFHDVYLTGETVKCFDWEINKKDGGKLDVESSVALLRDESGQPCGFRGMVRDISQRKQTERHLRLITENIRDVIWTMDFDGHFTYISPSVTTVFGYTPHEFSELSFADYMTNDSRALVEKAFSEELARAHAGHGRISDAHKILELEIVRKDGEKRWVEIQPDFNCNEQGVPFEILGITRDVTERKKVEDALKAAEKLYRMVVENINESVAVIDLNLQYIYQSPSEIRITGYTPEELMKIPSEKQLTPESYARGAAMLTCELEKEFSGEPVDPNRSRTIELEFYRKNGGTVWLEMTASFTRDETGKATGILMAGRNINERKKAEADKEKLEKQLFQLQKMETIGRLAGGVAHDFNNMLSVILGYIELVKLKIPANHPVLNDILEIEKAAGHSRDLTAQLLAFSRKQIIKPRVVDLNLIIAETQKTIARIIGEDIDLKFYQDGDLWTIKFDPLQAEQILINMAVNARDAMPKGGKLIIETSNINIDKTYYEAHLDLVPGQYVLLTVSDTGSGIDKDHIPYVFEPFFTTKDVGKGTGLGLATVYGIVKQNNGSIIVYSEKGKGSTFKIYLPRSVQAEVIQGTIPEATTSPGAGTILLVEDDKMVLKMVTNMLEALGYLVISSGNPLHALSLCEKGSMPIDLVITDVVMPGMSGRELRDKLLIARPELKVLFMSGYTSNIMAQHGVLEKGMEFIQKPFSMSILAAKVSKLIPVVKGSP